MNHDVAGITDAHDEGEEQYDFHCITCSDEALPFSVVSVDADRGMALVDTGNGRTPEEVDITLVDAVTSGDLLLVHGGVALNNLGKQVESELSDEQRQRRAARGR